MKHQTRHDLHLARKARRVAEVAARHAVRAVRRRGAEKRGGRGGGQARFAAAVALVISCVFVGLLGGGVAFAAPAVVPVTYADNSVIIDNGGVDAGPVVSVAGLPSSEAATVLASGVQFTAAGGTGTLKWAVNPASYDGYALAVSSTGDLTGTLITGATPGPVTAAASITVTATDANGAAGTDTLTIGPGPAVGTVALSQKADNVTGVSGTDDNVTGTVLFTAVPAPAAGVAADTFTAGNLPAGTTISAAGILTAASSVPGWYGSVTVTAADAAGAAAVEQVMIKVNGGPVTPVVPRLYGGHAVQINDVREWVYFVQGGTASCDHFVIVGPGKINGHQGWVNGHLGLNAAWYAGLQPHHTYTVYYQPVTACGSNDAIPGTHWGYVVFVS